MDYQTLMEVKTHPLTRAAEAWKALCGDFDKVLAEFKKDVCDALEDDSIWRGEAKDAATGHAQQMHKKMHDYRDKIEPVAKALRTAAEDVETYKGRLEGLSREINEREEWSIDSTGSISGPSGQHEQYEKYARERDGILEKAAEADRTASQALTSADETLGFLNKVLSEERGEEEQAAKRASKLASKSPEDLSFEEGKRLSRLLRDHGEDPAFAGEFLERVEPKQLLKLTDHLQGMGGSHWDNHGQGSGPDRGELISTLQRELGKTLAAGTSQQGSEYLGKDIHDENQQDKLDGRAAHYGKQLMDVAKNWDTGFLGMGSHEDSGYRAVGMLLHSGEYSEAFLNPVGDTLVAADKEDGFDTLDGDDLNHVDDRGRGGDPLLGLATALENSPDAASSFFDPQRNDQNLDHLLNREWEPDTYDHSPGPRSDTTPTSEEQALGHNLLGKALESATLDTQYRTPEGVRIMSEMVHEMANSDQSMHDPGKGTVPPSMRDSVGHMMSDYIGAVQDSVGPHGNTSDGLRLDGEDPKWTNHADGYPKPNFGEQDALKVMGSAAYDPDSYAEMRNANMVQTELRLDQLAQDESMDMSVRRGAMENVANGSQGYLEAWTRLARTRSTSFTTVRTPNTTQRSRLVACWRNGQ